MVRSAAPLNQSFQLAALVTALPAFLLLILLLLVLPASPLVILAAFTLLFLLVLAFFPGFGACAVLGLVGVFVCHGVTPLYEDVNPFLFADCRYTK
jgi:hypothetical protein